MMKIRPLLHALFCVSIVVAALLSGCDDAPEADAYGNFEAIEVTVSAQTDGRLLDFTVTEGDRLEVGAIVGRVDTTQWVAQLDNLHAQRRNLLEQKRSLLAQEKAARAQIDEAQAQSDALAAQLATATAERNRTQRLAATQAATARELSEREGLVNQLTAQVRQAEARVQTTRAQAEVFAIQASALDAQVSALDAQTRQIQDRLDNTILTNPRPGTILTVLARAGEVVRPGSQLYTIAELDPLILRAYATGNQLPRLKVGMTVDILVDDGQGGLESRQGTITFIAPDAEFTPTPIQTRDERAELVYAFEVRTPNPDGRLKIGMPGEVRFLTETQ